MNDSVASFTSPNLLTVEWTAPVAEAYQIMQAKKLRHLPVIDELGRVIGMLSDRDVLRAMQIDEATFGSGKTPQPEFDPRSLVRDFMSWPVESIPASRPIADAARMMVEKKISSLLVVSGDLIDGIVTSEDLLNAFIEHHESMAHQFKSKVTSAIYESPIGSIAQTFSNVGI